MRRRKLKKALIGAENFEFTNMEIIDIKSKIDLRNIWRNFYYSHYYQIHNCIEESYVFMYPRRSCDVICIAKVEGRSLPKRVNHSEMSLSRFQELVAPLIEDEKKQQTTKAAR